MLAKASTVLVGAFVTGSCSFVDCQSAHAADFTRAKKVFVPPSRIQRRFDSEAQEDGYASVVGPDSASNGYNAAFGVPANSSASAPPSKSKPSRYGLIPPPPPLTPSLLPAALMQFQAPPAMSGLAAPQQKGNWSTTPTNSATTMKAKSWSTSVQAGLKRASTSPKVASFIDQAQAKAQQLVKEGKVAQAQELLQNYVKNLPRDKALQTELANVTVQHAKQLMSSDNFQEAAKNLRSALTLSPSNTHAESMLATILQKQGLSASVAGDRLKAASTLAEEGKNSEADFEYKAALKLKPSADAHVGLGDLELKANNKEKASLEYQKALEVDPHSANALRQMGLLRLQQNDLPGASSNLSRALVVNPKDSVAASHLIDLWQKQVAHNPEEVNGHLGLARAYQLSGDLQSAQTEYRRVVQIDPRNPNLPAARQSFKLALARQDAQKTLDTAHSFENGGQLQQAYEKTAEAVALSPGDTSIRMYQGQLAEKLGLTSDANNIYSNILHDDPKNMAAAQRLAALANPSTASTAAAPSALPTVAATGLAAMAGLLPGLAPPVAPSFARGGSVAPTAPSYASSSAPSYGSANASSYSAANAPTYAAGPAPSFAAASAPSYGSASVPPNAASAAPQYAAGNVPPYAASAAPSYAAATPPTYASSAPSYAASSAPSYAASSAPSYAASSAPSYAAASSPPGAVFATPEAPPAASLPGIPKPPPSTASQSTPQVSSMAGFLSSMRTFTYKQKAAMEDSAEDIRAGLKAENSPPQPSPLAGAPPSTDGINSLTSDVSVPNDAPMLNAAGSNLANVQNLLKKIGAKSTPDLGAAAATASASAYTSAAPAAAPTWSGPSNRFKPYSSAAGQASAAQAATSQSSGISDALNQRLGNLESQNQQLQAQLQAAQQRLNAMQQQGSVGGPEPLPVEPVLRPSLPPTGVPASYMPQSFNAAGSTQLTSSALPSMSSASAAYAAAPSAVSYGSGLNSLGALSTGTATSSAADAALASLAASPAAASAFSNLSPSQQAQLRGLLKDRVASQPSNGYVRFELEGVKPSPTDIKLKVVLHNDQPVPLEIPDTAKAVIRMTGQPQRSVKIIFPTQTVAANADVHGFIKVPGHNLSPSADVFIPNLLPPSVADRDVHLTVPISYLK